MKPAFKVLSLLPFLCISVFAQKVHLPQWQNTPSHFNPAFTGISLNPQLKYTFHTHAVNLLPDLNTHTFSYDQQISPKYGFAGVSILRSKRFEPVNKTAAALQYAYKFSLKEDFDIRLGTEMGFYQLSFDEKRNYFNSRLIPKPTLIFNMNLGTVVSYRNIFAGFSIKNITNSTEYFINATRNYGLQYNSQVGAFIPLAKSNPKAIVLQPYMLAQHNKSKFSPDLSLGLNANKGIFTAGAIYSQVTPNSDMLTALIGVSAGHIKGGLSYNLSVSDARSPYENDISFNVSYYFGKPRVGSETGIPYYFRKMGF